MKDWVPIREAVDLLSDGLGLGDRAAAIVEERCRYGLWTAKAELRIEDRQGLGGRHEERRVANETVPPWAWGENCAGEVKALFDWQAGNYTRWEAWDRAGGIYFREVKLLNVYLRGDDLAAWLQDRGRTPDEETEANPFADCWIPFEDFEDAGDRAAGERWRAQAFWRWLDAAAWAACQDVELAKTLAAYRAMSDRIRLGDKLIERTQFLIIDSRDPTAIQVGSGKLLEELKSGAITGYLRDAQSGLPVALDPPDWFGMAENLREGGRNKVAHALMARAFVSGPELLKVWPGEATDADNIRRPLAKGERKLGGRQPGTHNYPSDPAVVQRVIAICDASPPNGTARVRRAIQSLISEVEPVSRPDRHEAHEGKIKRIRAKVLRERPDLAD